VLPYWSGVNRARRRGYGADITGSQLGALNGFLAIAITVDVELDVGLGRGLVTVEGVVGSTLGAPPVPVLATGAVSVGEGAVPFGGREVGDCEHASADKAVNTKLNPAKRI